MMSVWEATQFRRLVKFGMVNGSIFVFFFFVFQHHPILITQMNKTVITAEQAAFAWFFVFVTHNFFSRL